MSCTHEWQSVSQAGSIAQCNALLASPTTAASQRPTPPAPLLRPGCQARMPRCCWAQAGVQGLTGCQQWLWERQLGATYWWGAARPPPRCCWQAAVPRPASHHCCCLCRVARSGRMHTPPQPAPRSLGQAPPLWSSQRAPAQCDGGHGPHTESVHRVSGLGSDAMPSPTALQRQRQRQQQHWEEEEDRAQQQQTLK